MREAELSIRQIQRRAMWRMRLLALQDWLALSLVAGGCVAAAAFGCARLAWARPALGFLSLTAVWALITAGVVVALVFLARHLAAAHSCASGVHSTEREAAFLIDRALGLEDRVATAHAVIRRRSQGAVEDALILDAAERVDGLRTGRVLPYRLPRLQAAIRCRGSLSLAALVSLAALMVVSHMVLPAGELARVSSEQSKETAGAMSSAGRQLEQSAAQVERSVDPQSETARLAKEQGELGRSLQHEYEEGRRSGQAGPGWSSSRQAEALRKLNALADRIRSRHEELASTRAEEVVSLAERRLRSVLQDRVTGRVAQPRRQNESEGKRQIARAEDRVMPAKEARDRERTAERPSADASERPAGADRPKSRGAGVTATTKEPVEPTGKQTARAPNTDRERGVELPSDLPKPGPDGPGDSENAGGKRDPTDVQKESRDVSSLLEGQAAKVLPSEQLVKKAAELRANRLSAEDIKQLGQAAQVLARDLDKIASSKEFQQVLEQLARNVDPDQIERVARELRSQEKLREELKAAARLLMQNREAKELIAELAQRAGQFRAQNEHPQGSQERASGSEKPSGTSGRGALSSAGDPGQRNATLDARGQLEKLRDPNRTQRPPGAGGIDLAPGVSKRAGEYVYVRPKPGRGATRVPYSAAYPVYRREAERSVGRNQVPPHLRSLVRNYFDAINPDAQKAAQRSQ